MTFDLRRALHDYRQWVDDVCARNQGTRISPVDLVPYGYVPLQDLRDYFDENDLVRPFALANNGNMPMEQSLIVNRYLRIFATLSYISTPEDLMIWYLSNFGRKDRTDAKLPFHKIEDLDDIFGTTELGRQHKERFYRSHFKFSSQQLAEGTNTSLNETELALEVILPLRHVKNLYSGHGSDAKLELFELSASSGLQSRTSKIVAKIYPPAELHYTFRSELEAYLALKWQNGAQDSANYFLQYYGSFVQGTRGVILLEYADQGSLLDFFRRGQLPYTQEEMFLFWDRLSDLFLGLATIHGVRENEMQKIRGLHQDLKPSNIFVFSEGDPSQFNFWFKIGDFGLSSFEKTTSATESHLPDHKSTKVYGAPELMSWHSSLDALDLKINAAADMWSLGCVLFETAVWSVCGERGLEELVKLRQEEPCPPQARGRFHDGVQRLKALDTMTERIFERRRHYDNLTDDLCKWICEYLLASKSTNRLPAGQAHHHFGEMLRKHQVEVARLSTHSAHTSQSINSPTRDALGLQSPPGHPVTTSPSPDRPASQANSNFAAQRPLPAHQNHSAPDPPTFAIASYASEGTTWIPRAGTVGHSDLDIQQTRRHTHHDTRGTGSTGFQNNRFPALQEAEEIPSMVNDSRQSRGDFLEMLAASGPHTGVAGAQLGANPLGRTRSTTPTPSRKPSRTSQTQRLPDITIDELLAWKKSGQKRPGQSLPDALAEIPNALAGRDQVFLVDDSRSMTRHWSDVKKVIEALVWVVKRVDPDGVELRFTSKPTQKFKSKNSTELLERVTLNSPQSDSCMMQSALNILINSLVPASSNSTRRPRFLRGKEPTGISIYILTNAVWSGTSDYSSGQAGSSGLESPLAMCGVDSAVHTLIDRLRKGDHHSTYVTFQFIRFGHDSVGKRRLRYLDNEIPSEWDIVDRRYYKRGVRAMLIGAMNEGDYPSDDSDDE